MSTTGLVIAVDCSTTAAKAVVLDSAGIVVAQASYPLRTTQPRPAWHEQDAEQWWAATRSAVAEAVGALADPGRVAALCLTHQRESFVCLGSGGRPLRPAILWLDGRAHDEIASLGTARVHELSGKPPDTTPAIYKLAWLARHEPSILADAVHIGDVQAYLAWQLTGRWATGLGSADTLGLFDLQRGDWSAELLDLAGVRADQLPELVATGDQIALLTPDAARALGLPGPVPLVAGIGDGQSAGLALGATEPGVAYLNLGTSMVLGIQSDGYRWDAAFRTLAGIRPATYTFETVLNAAAYVATWCREQFGEPDADGATGAELEAAAALIPIGAEGLLTLPYWNAAQTPHWDALARGATLGWHGRHTAAHLYRSILEGVGFELRLHLERLEAVTGERVEVIRVVGGGARSPLWIRIVTDITGRAVRVCADSEVSAAGAGVLAREFLARSAAGSGTASSTRSSARPAERTAPAEHTAQPGRTEPAGRDVLPDPAVAPGYDALFAVYRQMYPALRGLFGELAAAAQTVARQKPPGPGR
ncbi:xylulokinase [Pengzhenrongella frigida]|uniref:Xylulose kinase n=1 Tax=Pengzhenrongella frigida TaxID=1259133 RepID=A0A4Q5N123_9MICO|nr:FGGY family carbohydrate kinase [Cellulomonas sp. HLT2-17]RYV50943.1 xylulose kinase [Cellulomonas sp. HLT2-17]